MPKIPLSQKEINRWAKEIEWGRRGKGIIYQNVKWPSPTKFFREAFKKPIVGKDKKGKEIAQWQNKLHPFYPVYYIVANQEERWKLQKEGTAKNREKNRLIKQIKDVLVPPHLQSYWNHGEDYILGQAYLLHKSGKPIGVQKDEGKVGRMFKRPLKTQQQKDAFYEYLKKEMKSGTDAYGNQYGIEHYKPIMPVIIDAYNDYRLHFDYDFLFGSEIGPNTPPQDDRPAFLYIDSPENGLSGAKKEWEKYKKPRFGDVSAKPKPKPTPKPKIPNPAFAKWLKDYENYEAHYRNLEKLSTRLIGLHEEQFLINATTTSSKIKDGKIDLTRTMDEGLDGGNKGNIDSDIEDILAEYPNTVRHFNIQYNGYDISMKSANSMREEIWSRRPPKYLMEKNAENKKINPIEKAGISGVASGATMEGLDLALGAEDFDAEDHLFINTHLHFNAEEPSAYDFVKDEIVKASPMNEIELNHFLDKLQNIPMSYLKEALTQAKKLQDNSVKAVLTMAINRRSFREEWASEEDDYVEMMSCPHCSEFGDGEIPTGVDIDSGDRWSPPTADITGWEMCEYCEGKGEVEDTPENQSIPTWDWDYLIPDEPDYDRYEGRYDDWDAETKLGKTSCCCGATTSNPCACMIQGVMECSATCPCSLEKKGAESNGDRQLEESIKRTKMSAVRTGLAITTFGIVLWNLWTNKKQEKQISDIMGLV